MKNENKVKIILIILLICFTIGIMITEVYAYFTSEAIASGGQKITIKHEAAGVNIVKLTDTSYEISVYNTGKADGYVRIKIFSVEELSYELKDWTQNEDGYFYYNSPLVAGQETGKMVIKTKTEKILDTTNIIVIQEITKAISDDNGNYYADWNFQITK